MAARPVAGQARSSDAARATLWGLFVAALLLVAIAFGSRGLKDFDTALVPYASASVFAAFGIAYRYSMWLRRPPTRLYWRRGWQLFLSPRRLPANLLRLVAVLWDNLLAQKFIERRSPLRWAAHACIFWGCVLAALVLLTVSARFLRGFHYGFLAQFHAITVIFTLLYLPFGKFFHIFQRPAQLSLDFYRRAGAQSGPAKCARCGEPFASRLHVDDLKRVEAELGIDYQIAPGVHYQDVCPGCRRRNLALIQDESMRAARREA